MEIAGSKPKVVITGTTWKNPVITGWIKNQCDGGYFSERDREVAFTTLLYVAEKYPQLKEIFGMEQETIGE